MTEESILGLDTITTIVRASFLACVGIAATGTFQNEINLNERLEVLVGERTKEIQEKNDRLHMVKLALRASETAIAITDSDLCVIWLNAACEEIASVTGDGKQEYSSSYRQEQETNKTLLGRSIVEVLALDTVLDEKKLLHAFSISRREDEISIRDMIYKLEVSPYQYSNPTGDNINTSGRYMIVLKNITAERAREVAEKTAQEEAMLAKAMSDSMVTLTHELRTPMQGIMGVTDMLLQQNKSNKNVDTGLIDSLKLIMASSELLLNLINNLLDVKKIDSEMMDEFPLSPVLARSAIQDSIDFCQPLASISGVTVVMDGVDDNMQDIQVMSNALRLQQVLINLVSNAIKYTSEQSQIRISIQTADKADVELKIRGALASSRSDACTTDTDDFLHSKNPFLCFSISDHGPGIASHQADRLFRRFARLDVKPTRTLGGSNKVGQPSGTGLGLNLCQLFVLRMGGEIWATNNENSSGSTFSFSLPLAVNSIVRTPTQTPQTNPTQSLSLQDIEMTTSLMRILLVDDVLINRKVIGRMVKLVGVSDIVTAGSGENALQELSHNGPYDLVITDLQMPGMSGSELCESIMSNNSSPNVRKPVVVGLTADTSVKMAEKCRASGMSTVLHKPISVVEMREFFVTTAMRLQPGVWCAGRKNGAILSAQ